ncbi:MAG TPA: AMP-binding protein, partial [Chitinophaga sp.]
MPSYSTFSEQLVRTDNTGCTSFMDLFGEQAGRLPEKIALVSEQREWSYEKLNELSNRLAFHLRTEYGVGKDRFVGIMTERSDWSIISMLAIWKAGGAFVPIDPQWPLERIRYIAEDTNLSVMLTQSAFIFNLPGID